MQRTKKTAIGGMTTALKANKLAGKNRRQPGKTAPAVEAGELVCRYCGSDDLAPSFIKRRDARCRACFKQRYGSTTRTKAKSKSAA